MVMNDTLATALSKMLNAEKIGNNEVIIRPKSKTLKKVLTILQEKNFIGGFEDVEDSRGGYLVVNLIGNINKCGAIKPRFSVRMENYDKWEKRYLPAKDFGVIIISTPKGIMTHIQSRSKNLGGRLIAYCY